MKNPKRKTKAPKEQQIQRAILEYLWVNKIKAWKNNNAAIKKPNGQWIPVGVKGVSDILGSLKPNGRLLAIEVKRPGGKVSEDQQVFIDEVNATGGLAFVAYSVDDVIEHMGIAC